MKISHDVGDGNLTFSDGGNQLNFCHFMNAMPRTSYNSTVNSVRPPTRHPNPLF